jgi:hypothetical protein
MKLHGLKAGGDAGSKLYDREKVGSSSAAFLD